MVLAAGQSKTALSTIGVVFSRRTYAKDRYRRYKHTPALSHSETHLQTDLAIEGLRHSVTIQQRTSISKCANRSVLNKSQAYAQERFQPR